MIDVKPTEKLCLEILSFMYACVMETWKKETHELERKVGS